MALKEKREKKEKKEKGSKKSTASSSAASLLATDSNRTASGVLTSQSDARDIKIEEFSLNFYSQSLVQDSSIELNFGRRYAVLGPNGCGKSTFLQALAAW
jgi:ATP-binding cassette subfamily F protein 2